MDIFDRTKRALHDLGVWATYNPDKAALLGGTVAAVLGGVCKLSKEIRHESRIREERDLKNLYIYDRSLGCWHRLRRPMRPSEKLEMEQRKARGERLSYILSSMKLLA